MIQCSNSLFRKLDRDCRENPARFAPSRAEEAARPEAKLLIKSLCEGARDGGLASACHTSEPKNALAFRIVGPLGDPVKRLLASTLETMHKISFSVRIVGCSVGKFEHR